MDYSDVYGVCEISDSAKATELLSTGFWTLLAVATGYKEDNTPYFLYSIGDTRPRKEKWIEESDYVD